MRKVNPINSVLEAMNDKSKSEHNSNSNFTNLFPENALFDVKDIYGIKYNYKFDSASHELYTDAPDEGFNTVCNNLINHGFYEQDSDVFDDDNEIAIFTGVFHNQNLLITLNKTDGELTADVKLDPTEYQWYFDELNSKKSELTDADNEEETDEELDKEYPDVTPTNEDLDSDIDNAVNNETDDNDDENMEIYSTVLKNFVNNGLAKLFNDPDLGSKVDNTGKVVVNFNTDSSGKKLTNAKFVKNGNMYTYKLKKGYQDLPNDLNLNIIVTNGLTNDTSKLSLSATGTDNNSNALKNTNLTSAVIDFKNTAKNVGKSFLKQLWSNGKSESCQPLNEAYLDKMISNQIDYVVPSANQYLKKVINPVNNKPYYIMEYDYDNFTGDSVYELFNTAKINVIKINDDSSEETVGYFKIGRGKSINSNRQVVKYHYFDKDSNHPDELVNQAYTEAQNARPNDYAQGIVARLGYWISKDIQKEK